MLLGYGVVGFLMLAEELDIAHISFRKQDFAVSF
jgi:hypothetical protein